MHLSKISALVGGTLALVYIFKELCIAIAISKSFSFGEGLLPELVVLLIVGSIFLSPAVILLTAAPFTSLYEKLSLLYPITTAASMYHVFVGSTDALEAGLPIVIFVFPFLITFSILLFTVSQQKEDS